MALFSKSKEPIFLKENSSANATLSKLQELSKTAPEKIKTLIEQDIRAIKAGIVGEENIMFELRNSHVPMYVLHDAYFTRGDLSVQIDYLIITRCRVFIVECKNLYGNIEINSDGNFIRSVSFNGKSKKEGIYSPITQNSRHLEMVKSIISDAQSNALSRALFEKSFYENFRSLVVLANPNTVLNSKYAKKEVKQKVIRADQLVEYIKKVNSENDAVKSSEKQTEVLANFLLKKSVENPIDYIEKYRVMIGNNTEGAEESKDNMTPCVSEPTTENVVPPNGTTEEIQVLCPICGAEMVRRKAKRGANAGHEFYGCSKYPKCHGIVNIVTQ